MTRKELEQLIAELYGVEAINSMIDAQITKFQKLHGYTEKDIARAVAYYVEVLGNVPDRRKGIGIVPFVMEEANRYYNAQAVERSRLKDEAQKIKQGETKVIKVKPKKYKPHSGRYIVDIENL
jgi:hypothetical protein